MRISAYVSVCLIISICACVCVHQLPAKLNHACPYLNIHTHTHRHVYPTSQTCVPSLHKNRSLNPKNGVCVHTNTCIRLHAYAYQRHKGRTSVSTPPLCPNSEYRHIISIHTYAYDRHDRHKGRTSVSTPPLRPNSISVSIRSPIITVRFLLIPCSRNACVCPSLSVSLSLSLSLSLNVYVYVCTYGKYAYASISVSIRSLIITVRFLLMPCHVMHECVSLSLYVCVCTVLKIRIHTQQYSTHAHLLNIGTHTHCIKAKHASHLCGLEYIEEHGSRLADVDRRFPGTKF